MTDPRLARYADRRSEPIPEAATLGGGQDAQRNADADGE